MTISGCSSLIFRSMKPILCLKAGSFFRLKATLFNSGERLFSGVGKKFGLSKLYTGAFTLVVKKEGISRRLLLPTSIATTSSPCCLKICSNVIAWVKCPRPSP